MYNNIKYNIHQVVFPVNKSSIMDTMYGMKIIKESRFGYTRLIDGITMFKLYNCSNITGLESAVHEGVQVVVEISNGCLILFTGDTFHT